ncbi:MAG: adenylate/guanylate cyclase domain-containing protein [Terriglobales bacterium]
MRAAVRWLSRQSHAAIAAAATAAGLALFAYSGIGGNQRAGFLLIQDIEQRTLDLRFAMRGKREVDPRIVIVGIDDKTLQTIGSFPLPRSNYALLVRQLKQDGARVIAFDVTFPTAASSEALDVLARLRSEIGHSAPAGLQKKVQQLEQQADVDAQFAAALKDAGNVVLGHLFLSAERSKFTDPKLAEAYFNIAWAKAFPQVLKVKSKNRGSDGGDFDLGQAWIQAGGPVAAGVEANLPKLAEAAASYGFFNIAPDADGTIRRALFVIRYQDQDFFPSLALQALRQYENIPDQQIAAYISADGMERIQFGDHQLHPWQNGSALINFAGPYHSYPHYSMVDVLRGTVPADAFRDKIVFVGGTALGIGDLRNTPFEKQGAGYMGVEVHANILDNLLHSSEPQHTFLIRGVNEEIVDIAFIVFFGLGLGLWFGHSRPLIATLTAMAALGAFLAFIYYGFAHWGRWYSFVVPAATLVGSYASITSFRVIHEEREKRKIRKTFSQYLSPGVIALIEKDPQKYIRPGGEVRDLTVMFSDIRDFTTLSEGLTPNELVTLLNEYLGAMTDILFRNLGTLDKYIGDAIMAFWGSPYPQQDHAYSACCCALEMIAALEELNRKWAEQGRRPIAIGIGLNTGPVNVGNMGSDKRLAWTVMGDNVNLASRLEGMTKQYRARVIISESTYDQVAHQFVAREVDRIRVKGKKQPVVIYELLAPISERDAYAPLLAQYNAALDVYRSQNWQEATGKFGELLAVYPDDGPTQVLLQRCIEFMEEAPDPEWDGVYVMKSK